MARAAVAGLGRQSITIGRKDNGKQDYQPSLPEFGTLAG
jgi:hypothetical protein